MRPARALWAASTLLVPAGCGDGGSPFMPPPVQFFPLTAVVFYDENGNGVPDEGETARLGEVVLSVGALTATTEHGSGRATLRVPGGTQVLRVRADSLPPYFRAPDPVTLTVPATGDVLIAVTLPIGANVPHTYLAMGDSITVGDGSSDGRGYVGRLEDRLRAEWGQATFINEGIDGGKSNQGASRLGGLLSLHRPAGVTILMGTNDWNHCDDVDSCFTQDAMRSMLDQALANQSVPFMATIIPANTGFDARTPPSRNEWNEAMNERLKAIARERGVAVVDLYAAMTRAANGDLAQLFADHVHPNDRGHQVLADEFFRVITSPASATQTGTSANPSLLFANPRGGLEFGFGDDGGGSTREGLPDIQILPAPSTAPRP